MTAECPSCHGNAVVEFVQEGMRMRTCSTCGWTISDAACSTRGCGRYSWARCKECRDAYCRMHLGKSKKRMCSKCKRRQKQDQKAVEVRQWWND